MTNKKKEAVLKRLYSDLDSGTGLSSANLLYTEAKKIVPTLKLNDVRRFLDKSYVHIRTSKSLKPRGKSRRSVPLGTMSLHRMDCDLAIFKGNVRPYLLLCRQHLSGRFFAKPFKKKTAPATGAVFKQLMMEQNDGKWPATMRTDFGSEFKKGFRDVFPEGTKFQYTQADQKAGLAEGGIAAYRNLLQKMVLATGIRDYTKLNDTIVSNLNDRIHPKTGLKPSEVTSSNAPIVWQRKYGKRYVDQLLNGPVPKYDRGDLVRINLAKKQTFEKGSMPGFSQELFKIADVRPTDPITYLIEDREGSQLNPPFYERQVRLAEPNADRHKRIEKIIRRKGSQSLVRFRGIPKESNFRDQWIETGDIAKFRRRYE